MMDKVVSSIIQAEEYAKQMVLDAEKSASDLLAKTDGVIEQENRQATEENKKYLSGRMKEFSAEATKEAEQYRESNKQKIDEIIQGYRANIDTAVDKVIGTL